MSCEGVEDGVQKHAARVIGPAIFLAGLVEVRADTATLLSHSFINIPLLLIGLSVANLDYEIPPDRDSERVTGSPPEGAAAGLSAIET